MNEYVKALKHHVPENPPHCGVAAHFVLEMLCAHCHECNNTGSDTIKVAFEDLCQRMHGMPLREMDRIVDAVSTF